jgi:hypothetical protein
MAAGQIVYTPQHVILPQGAPGDAQGPDIAPNSAIMGFAVADPRPPYAPNDTHGAIKAWFANTSCKVVGQAPATAATANMAALQVAASGTPFTLVSSTGAGITLLATAFLALGSGNTIPVGSLAIDGNPIYTTFGQGFHSGFYAPSGGLARAVSVTAASSATGGVVTIRGADYYGYPMAEEITAVAASTVNGLKAFKWVFSATPGFTDGTHNYSIGTADVYGLNLRADNFADIVSFFDDVVLAKAAFTAAVSTTATATTGDVRGTLSTGVTANGTKVLAAFVRPTLTMMANASLSVGMFGVAQFNE